MRNFRKIIVVAVTMLILLGVTVTPAYAWKFTDIFESFGVNQDQTNKLDKIDKQIWKLSENDKLMEFINLNMHEQNVRYITIDITEDGEVLESYYIYRGEEGNPAYISSDENNIGNTWTFKPTIKQTQTGLDILKSKTLSVKLVFKCLYLWISVEQENNVPSLDKIIKKSSWISGFLP